LSFYVHQNPLTRGGRWGNNWGHISSSKTGCPQLPLTDAKIRSAAPRDKSFRIYDSRGMYLEVSPTGGRWWRWKYRVASKEKRLSLGTYPDVSLKEARERRDAARRLLSDGVDPGENRKAIKLARAGSAENSFEAVAREWFGKFSPGWAESHAGRMMRRLERDVFPWIGARPIREISAPELLAVVRRIEGRTVETAHRAMRSCGQIFRYAISTGRCERDPSADLKGALPPAERNHFAAVTDPERLGAILRALDAYRGTLTVQSALRLAPLVFVRPGELRMAEWAHIDLGRAEWAFTVSKTKQPHIVPLAHQAVAILKEIHPVTGHGRYVFPGARSAKRPMSDAAILVALRAMEISAQELHAHGFRAIARTLLDERLGFRPDIIEHQLAHAVRDPLGRAYNRTSFLLERKVMMQQWADYLDRLKSEHPVPHPGTNLVSK
jgi:integrase